MVNLPIEGMDLLISRHAASVEELCTPIGKNIAVTMTLTRLTIEVYLISLIKKCCCMMKETISLDVFKQGS